MNYYFIAILILYAMNFGINLSRHGQTKEEKYNCFNTLIATIIEVTLIYFAIKTGFQED